MTIAPLARDETEGINPALGGNDLHDSTLVIPFQNENLCAELVDAGGARRVRISHFLHKNNSLSVISSRAVAIDAGDGT